jgi:hypothetical protein
VRNEGFSRICLFLGLNLPRSEKTLSCEIDLIRCDFRALLIFIHHFLPLLLLFIKLYNNLLNQWHLLSESLSVFLFEISYKLEDFKNLSSDEFFNVRWVQIEWFKRARL